jgi:hypothetical protein
MKRVLFATSALAVIGQLVLAQSNTPTNEKWDDVDSESITIMKDAK